jgi:hypothetical protein
MDPGDGVSAPKASPTELSPIGATSCAGQAHALRLVPGDTHTPTHPTCPHTCRPRQVEAQRAEWDALHSRFAPHLPPGAASPEAWRWALSIVRSRSFAAPDLPLPLGRVAAAAAAAQAGVLAAGAAAGAAAAGGAEAVVLLAAAGAAALASNAAASAGGDGGGASPARRVMCPLIDLFNHSSTTGACCELDSWSGDFKVAAREAVAAGKEVRLRRAGSRRRRRRLSICWGIPLGRGQGLALARAVARIVTL